MNIKNLTLISVLASCGGQGTPDKLVNPTENPGPPSPLVDGSFKNIQAIMNRSCYSCHADLAAWTELDFATHSKNGAYYVSSGKPDSSMIYYRLKGTGTKGDMPSAAGPLNQAEIESFAAWINAYQLPDNQAPVVRATAPARVELRQSATLNAQATDDGLPVGSYVTFQWKQVSGPGSASFSNFKQANTTVTFSKIGTYVLRLEAFDGFQAGFAQVNVTVYQGNAIPVVSPGSNQTILIKDKADLNGSAKDGDGPQALKFTWSKVSGPGAVSFDNSAAAHTAASFSMVGVFVLRLSAFDGTDTGVADVSITVNPNPGNASERYKMAKAALDNSCASCHANKKNPKFNSYAGETDFINNRLVATSKTPRDSKIWRSIGNNGGSMPSVSQADLETIKVWLENIGNP